MGLFASAEEKAQRAYDEGLWMLYKSTDKNHFQKAEKYLGKAMAAGYTQAMYEYGMLYELSGGQYGDIGKIEQAAEAGAVKAMLYLMDESMKDYVEYLSRSLSASPAEAEKVPWYREQALQHREKALHWAKRATEAGAPYLEGVLAALEEGDLPRLAQKLSDRGRPDTALMYMKWLAEAGDIPAMFWCGQFIAKGAGAKDEKERVKADRKKAKEWYDRAAATGEPDALYRYGRLIETLKVDPPQDKIIPHAVEEYFAKAALAGHAQAAERYLTLFEKDYFGGFADETVAQLQRLAKDGEPWAGYLCAGLKLRGAEIDIPDEQLLRLCEEAAEQGPAPVWYELARLLDEGRLCAPDRQRAFFWYEKAAAAGHLPSCLRAGEMYISGEGGQKDVPKGIELAERGAQPGPDKIRAWAAIGRAYLEGDGVPRDLEKACEKYVKAAVDLHATPGIHKGDSTDLQLYKVGEALFARQQYETAMPLLRNAAGPLGGGYVGAYLRMALLYRHGLPNLDANAKAAALRYRSWYESLSPGDMVRFGAYPMNGSPDSFEKEGRVRYNQVRWHVLEVKDGQVLLLCARGLEYSALGRLSETLFDEFEQPFVKKGPFNLSKAEFERYLAGQDRVPVMTQASIWATIKRAESMGFEWSYTSGGGLRISTEAMTNKYDEIITVDKDMKEQQLRELTADHTPWVLADNWAVQGNEPKQYKWISDCVVRPAVWVKMPPPPKQA